MNKTLMLDVVMQQLESLSIEELLDVRTKVDALIQMKSSRLANIDNSRSYSAKMIERYSLLSDILEAATSNEWLVEVRETLTQTVNLEVNTDNSLEKIIELVDEWMADESDYDQETYPQIEAALNQNRVSL